VNRRVLHNDTYLDALRAECRRLSGALNELSGLPAYERESAVRLVRRIERHADAIRTALGSR